MIRFFTKTAIGYSHIRAGKVCQDFSASYHDGDRTIVTACDGHGGAVYLRSDRGSRFASEAVIRTFRDVDKYTFHRAKREEVEKKLRLGILCEWNAQVEQDLAKRPIARRELSALDEDKRFRLKTEPQVAYGTTLNGAMIFGNKLFCASLGDGGCFVFKRGDVRPVFDDDADENVANLTYSMCQSDAFQHLKVRILDLQEVDGVIVFTDGLINPYRSLENFASSLVRPAVTRLLRRRTDDLDSFVTELGSEKGIGDDVSLGLLLAPSAQPWYYEWRK